jgi:hypothetical protein
MEMALKDAAEPKKLEEEPGEVPSAPETPAENDAAPADAFAAVEAHPKHAALVELARAVLSRMCSERKTAPDRATAEAKATALELERDDCGTPFGNGADVLFRGPEDSAERQLAGALAAHSIALGDPSDDAAPKLAEELVWLAAHTPFDGLEWLDALPAKKRPWRAIAEAVKGKVLDRAEKLVACAALARSESDVARKSLASLADIEDADPLLAAVLGARSTASETIAGRVGPAPRKAWATVVLGMTGLLFVIGAARLFARGVLAYKTPAEVSIAGDSVTVRWKSILLGRTLRDREVVLPRDGLAAVVREVRYPSLHLYAGLVALAIGSYFGMSMVVDGFRAWSTSLLGAGLLVILAGIALDFALASIVPGTKGKCRVILRPRRGPTLSIENVDPKRADAALSRLR